MLDMSKLSEHDRQLVEKARKITNPIDWWDVPDENLAESKEVKEYLHFHSTYLYHKEEGEWI